MSTLSIVSMLFGLVFLGLGIFLVVYTPKDLDKKNKFERKLYEKHHSKIIGGIMIALGIFFLAYQGYHHFKKGSGDTHVDSVAINKGSGDSVAKSEFGFKFY
jgi:amino acid transporter